MARKRITMESSRSGAFVPWSWYCEDQTANPPLADRFGFFQSWGFREMELWRSIDESVRGPCEPCRLPVPARPNCPKCLAGAVADIDPDWECMSCGTIFSKTPLTRVP